MRIGTLALAFSAAALLAVACSSPAAPPTPTPAPTATPSVSLSPTAAKYLLMVRFGDIFFCDPDFYPVGRPGQEEQQAQDRFPTLQQNTEEFAAITAHLGLQGLTSFTAEQKLQVYREHKRLTALQLASAQTGYTFTLRVGQNQGTAYEGTVTLQGAITVTKQEPVFNTCPICLSRDALIATPNGAVAVQDLLVGMAVWTSDSAGNRIPAVVLQTIRREGAPGSLGLQLQLEDGRHLLVSPSHPSLDGRLLASYTVGDMLDGSPIRSLTLAPFPDNFTYDLLPSGPTGAYWADGIALRSTLRP